MSKTYSMTGPDGKTYSIVGPDNADPEEVKQRIKANYKTSKTPPPTMGQRLKSAASKVATKVGPEIEKAIPSFMKQPMTWPEIGGQMAGQVIGSALGGSPSAIVGGALGGAGGRAVGELPRTIGEMIATKSMRGPLSRVGQEMIPAAERGATFTAAGEALPIVWRGAKFLGREAREGLGALSGVTERVEQLRKLPLWEQIKVLNPFGKSIPAPGVAGAAQGEVEKRLGIPTMEETTRARIYSEPKAKAPKTSVSPSMIANPEQRAIVEEAMGKSKVPFSPKTGESTPVMRSTAKAFEQGVKPPVNDAVQALRDIFYRQGKLMEGDPAGVIYGKDANRLVKFIENEVEELGKARKLTHLAHLRDSLWHILPLSPKGTPYRFGVMRILWRAASFLITGGLMSPIGSGVSAVLSDLFTKGADPLLGSRFTAPAISGALATQQKLKKRPPE